MAKQKFKNIFHLARNEIGALAINLVVSADDLVSVF